MVKKTVMNNRFYMLVLVLFTACYPQPISHDLSVAGTSAVATQNYVHQSLAATARSATQQANSEYAESTQIAIIAQSTQQSIEQSIYVDQMTATAHAEQVIANNERVASNATSTAIAVNTDLMIYETSARYARMQMTNTMYALVPWMFMIAFGVALIAFGWRYGSAVVNQKNTIRDGQNNPYTLIYQGKLHDYIMELPQALPQVEQPTREIKSLPYFANQPKRRQRIIHPKFGIDPNTLDEIPLFDSGSRLMSGASGSGKTNLALYDVHRLNAPDIVVYDPKNSIGKWGGSDILLEPAELYERLTQQEKLFKERREEVRQEWSQSITVIDEFTALNIMSRYDDMIPKCIALIWSLVLRGREFGINLWLLAQSDRAQSLGVSGMGDFRKSLTKIDFPWKPSTRREYHIPRIAVVDDNKYRVPLFNQEFLPVEQSEITDNDIVEAYERLGTQKAVEEELFGYTGGKAYNRVKKAILPVVGG